MRLRLFLMVPIALASALGHAPAAAAAAAKPPSHALEAAPGRSSLAGLELYSVDGGHSVVEFSVRWMGLSRVRGSFSEIRSTLTYDSTDVTRSSITVVLGAASLYTANERRDKDLKGPDWFDVEKYPRITFRSSRVERSGDGLSVRGDLTIRDVTRPVAIRARDVGSFVFSPFGWRRAFSGTFTLDRKDYGIVGPQRFNNVIQTLGKKLLGDEIVVEIELQATAQSGDQADGPVVDSLAARIEARGVPGLAVEYRAARAQAPRPDSMRVDEDAFNALGYRLLRHGRADQAIEVFTLEAEAYPSSVFSQVGLGQAYAVLGQRERAAEHCQRAIELNPNATRAMEVLRRVRER